MITEELVLGVVSEVSERMKDPSYAQVAIGAFVEAHPDVGRWLSAQTTTLGGGEGVMQGVFHAEVLAECIRRHRGVEELNPVRFRLLDATAKQGDAGATLREREPALAAYIESNVELIALRRVLCLVGLALVASR